MLESLFNAQIFSCEFCKISKNTFCYRTSPVAASETFSSLSVKTADVVKL